MKNLLGTILVVRSSSIQNLSKNDNQKMKVSTEIIVKTNEKLYVVILLIKHSRCAIYLRMRKF